MIETKLDGKTPDIAEENIAKLKEIFPDVFCEGKVDFEKLQQVLGNYIEDEDERYNFSWNGKGRSLRLAQSPSTGTLRPCKEESKDWNTTENLYVEGDNLEVLKLLQKSYHGKIKMIYIDPPYNTGHDFVYPDDYTDNMQNYLELTGQVDSEGKKITTNPDTNGRYHTDWLNMMYPRLRLARNLLADDGVIFISIGQAEIENLLKVCNELYGENNHIGTISRMMKSGGNKGQYFSPNIEYILVYAKNILNLGYFREPISEELIEKVYNQIETEGVRKGEKYRVMGLFQAGLDVRPNQRYWIKCPDGSYAIPKGNTFPQVKKTGEKVKPNDGDGVWRWSNERLLHELEKGNVLFKETSTSSLIDENGNQSKWNIYTKIWLNDRLEDGRVPVDLITKWENRNSSIELKELNIPFDFAKPVDLLKYLVSIVDNTTDSIILDFFSGSATTAHAVMQLNAEDGGNRKFICVQLPEPTDEKSEAYKAGYRNICEIGKERIRRAGEKINAEIMESNKQIALDEEEKKFVDVGFKVFKLDTSNIKKWNPDFDNLEDSFVDSINNLVDGRSELDLVYEIMLKYGLDLTYPVEELSCGDKKIYSIAFGMLVICVAEGVSKDVADFIVEYKKQNNIEEMRTVFKDGCFKDDSTQMSIKETLKSAGIEEFITI